MTPAADPLLSTITFTQPASDSRLIMRRTCSTTSGYGEPVVETRRGRVQIRHRRRKLLSLEPASFFAPRAE